MKWDDISWNIIALFIISRIMWDDISWNIALFIISRIMWDDISWNIALFMISRMMWDEVFSSWLNIALVAAIFFLIYKVSGKQTIIRRHLKFRFLIGLIGVIMFMYHWCVN